MSNITIQCPTCSKKGSITISEETIKNIVRCILAVNIAEEIICAHSFIVYVDKNYQFYF